MTRVERRDASPSTPSIDARRDDPTAVGGAPVPKEDALRWTRTWRAIGFLLCGVVVYLSLKEEPIALGNGHGGRFDHVIAYAVLMLWHAQLHRATRERLACAIAFVAMGIALEFLQRLTETRTFSAFDMVANVVGVAAGWLLSPPRSPHLLRRLEARWRVRRT